VHEPRGGSKASGSGRCTTTRRASRTGWRPASRPKARLPADRLPRRSRAGRYRPAISTNPSGTFGNAFGAAGWDACVVVNEKRIVIGLLRVDQLAQEGEVTAGSAMRPGPSTFRPHVAIEEMAKVMAARDLPNVPVTTSAGELIGLLVREDVERAVHERRGGPS
jgi:CBS domain-containing protein